MIQVVRVMNRAIERGIKVIRIGAGQGSHWWIRAIVPNSVGLFRCSFVQPHMAMGSSGEKAFIITEIRRIHDRRIVRDMNDWFKRTQTKYETTYDAS